MIVGMITMHKLKRHTITKWKPEIKWVQEHQIQWHLKHGWKLAEGEEVEA